MLPGEVRPAGSGVVDGERALAAGERDPAGDPQRQLEAHVDRVGVRAACASSAARQRAFIHMPCAIAPGWPNSRARQRVQVDRVAVARHARRSGGRCRRATVPDRARRRSRRARRCRRPSRRRRSRCRYVLRPRHTSSPLDRSPPRRCRTACRARGGAQVLPRARAGRAARPRRAAAAARSGCATWTSPSGENGNDASVISSIASGNASTCG